MRQGWRAPGEGVESALKLCVPVMRTRRAGIRWSTSERHLLAGDVWPVLCLECSPMLLGCCWLIACGIWLCWSSWAPGSAWWGLWVGMVCGVGLVRGSCGRCCETWDDVELFTDHRRGEACVSGGVMGLARTRNGIWLRQVDGLSQAS